MYFPTRIRFHFILLLVSIVSVSISTSNRLSAEIITGGSLSFDLDGAAFANNIDSAWLQGVGVNPTAGQTLLEFAKHSPNAPAGRPRPSNEVVDFNEIRSGWIRPSSSGLQYGFNGDTSLQTFSFNPLNVATNGATGKIRFTGGDSFWFANQALIDTGSIWIEYGDLDLRYDAARNDGINSGWIFTNNVLVTDVDVFDVRNAAFNISSNSFNFSGDLFINEGFRDFTGLTAGTHVGSFQFSGISAVPEPSSMLLLGAISVVGYVVRRRRTLGFSKSNQASNQL
jgi:hypothetical protein